MVERVCHFHEAAGPEQPGKLENVLIADRDAGEPIPYSADQPTGANGDRELVLSDLHVVNVRRAKLDLGDVDSVNLLHLLAKPRIQRLVR